MPMIDIYFTQGSFSDAAQATLVDQLTALLLEMEGALDNRQSRALSWCFLHPLPTGSINQAGKPATMPLYKCVFSVPEGTRGLHGPLAHPRRDELVRRATQLILTAEGAEDNAANRFRVWCFIHEVPEASWGGMGRLVRMADISSFVRAEEKPTPIAAEARSAVTV